MDAPNINIPMYKIEDQTKHAIKKKEKPTSEYTPEKIRSMLENYIKVPKEEWLNIPCGCHVRYFHKDGRFIAGGLVHNVNYNTQTIWLQNRPSSGMPGYKKWPVSINILSSLYKKIDKSTLNDMRIAALEMSLHDS